ncbi:MAG: MFS transporter [Caulobacter sp.]|nr:MFS transporter [Caulobacter sp.]
MSVNKSNLGQPGSPHGRAMITVVVGVMVFLSGVFVGALGPLLPALQTQYDIGVVAVSWVFTLLLIGSAVGLAILPRLADLVGDKVTITLAPAMLAAGLALAATGSFAALLVGALGIGVGGMAPAMAVAALRRSLPGESIRRAVSITMTCVLLGTGLGFIAGGAALHYISLRDWFVIAAIASALVAAAVYVVFPHIPAADRGSLGFVSVGVLVGWIVAILFAISKGPAWGWADPKTLGLIAAGVFTAIVWARRELKLDTPVIDLTLLKSTQFRRTLFGGVTLGMGGSAFTVLFPMIAQVKGAGFGPEATILQTGFIMLPYALVGVLGVAVGSRMVARGYPLVAAGLGALGHGSGALWVAFFHDSEWQLLAGAAIYGIGIGLLNCGLMSSIQKAVPEAKAGMASAMLGLTTVLAGSVGPIIYSIILVQKSVPWLPGVPAEGQFVIAFLVNAAIDLTCAIVCLRSLLRPKPDAEADRSLLTGDPAAESYMEGRTPT